MAKFETNLNQKDKATIVGLLAFVGVFMFVWFGIRPAINDIKSLNDDIDHAQTIEAQYRNKIINLASAEAIYDRSVTDLNESTEEFYEKMPSSSIDRMMTSYVLGFGLYPEDLYITMPSGPVEETPYIYSQAMERQVSAIVESVAPTPTPTVVSTGLSGSSASSEESSSDTNSFAADTQVDSLLTPYTDAMNSAISTQSSGIEAVDITMVMTGSPEVCQALIDDLCTKPSVRLTGFIWSKLEQIEQFNEETGETVLVDSDMVRLQVDLRLYMADITDYEASVAEAVEAAAVTEE
ncbi:MAG: hypothetical protein K6F45_10545 [Saccharofermentans sp.]|nr:hypothetical protein [Saccharofermentans sp.]